MSRDHFQDINATIGDVAGVVAVFVWAPNPWIAAALAVPGAAAGFAIGFYAAKGVIVFYDTAVCMYQVSRNIVIGTVRLGARAWSTRRSKPLVTAPDSVTRR